MNISRALGNVHEAVEKIAARKFVKGFIRREKDKRRIAEAKGKIEAAFSRFNVSQSYCLLCRAHNCCDT